jgi:hypothetical protein
VTDETVPAASHDAGPASLPTSQPVLLRGLRYEIIATVALMLLFGAVGYLVSQAPGAIGGVLGAFLAGLLSCVTIGSILFANRRFIQNPNFVVIFFAIVAGGWLLKLIVFILAMVLLRGQDWLDPKILFFGLVSGIVVSLVIDSLVVVKARLPYSSEPIV